MDYTIDVIDACRKVAMNLTNDVLSGIPKPPDGYYAKSLSLIHI